MEATATVSSAGPSTTGSSTIADLIPRAAAEHAEHTAVRFKRGGAWHDVSYAELATIVQEIGLGLIDLGIEPGERVCILANTRPEWSYADLAATAAGAVVVPIYQTNSPEECLWVISDSGASAIICEDEEQLAKIAAIRDQLPDLRTVIVIDPTVDEASSEAAANGAPSAAEALQAITLEQVRERGRSRSSEELDARRAAVRPEDPYTFIYTSGTTGPPKGCVLTHGNYRAIVNMIGECRRDHRRRGRLPVPTARSLVRAAGPARRLRPRWHARLLRRRHQADRARADGGQTDIPAVGAARVREDLHARARRDRGQAARGAPACPGGDQARCEGARHDQPRRTGARRAAEALRRSRRASCSSSSARSSAGTCATRPAARRRSRKEILEFFWACGVPVLEGYGMTETATAATVSTVENHRFGTVGRALPGVELKIADDGEILIKGPNIFAGYHNRAEESFGAVEDGWMHTGDLGSLDEDGYLSITGRKKDIIITAGGKNLTPANIENDLKQCRWISQAVMHGDQRPYPVVLITLDEEEIPSYAHEHDLPQDIPSLARSEEVRALIQREIDRANAKYAQVEQVKKFAILDHDLSQATGELTPTLKVKRNVVNEQYAELFDALYTG